ncbi:enamine deaminase RidA (YjgF/YER057c/UK114 family) [Rhizobium sp. PP-F2F-G38]|nr:enamine deaminase RidA (YjgF/YER057c/UK114 family) [Rhizobium sp. PP-WC-1G-195]PYE96663.1 enamine deaminase RidA (YjgF/YER057c/UK114 family) [Rhizobium sp. PP-F2F-G38]TCP86075.1 enamine deaminase RidA (YjgF/YER057c/UK114 family) [Rhizobium sp. PP-CC-2G-626]TCQ23652.1 enamine deaminase RidA (YjgF/YER057c/UK114 family) [Rhizobium sp. PP-CC-3G-465]
MQGIFSEISTSSSALKPAHRPISVSGIAPPLAAYSHGVDVTPGARLVFCSGQLGLGADDIVPPDCEGQAEICFANIKAILAGAGMSLAHVVRINAYVTGREHLAPYMRVRDRLFAEHPPASTLMIVSGFTRPEFVVEIEVVAAAVETPLAEEEPRP